MLVGCGETYPIHEAVEKGNIEAVLKHIANGEDINTKDEWNSTPLFYAAYGGHKEIAELLIAKGADVNAKVRSDKGIPGLTPLFYAARGDQPKVAALLIAKGAMVNVTDDNGATPLDYAMIDNHSETADLLRKHGAKTGEELKAEGK